MFRNQYDMDVTVFSPQGRLHQLEYAMEAVKLGTAAVGLKNESAIVILCVNKIVSELAMCQKKIIPIDKHVGIAFSGLTADAKVLSRFLRLECLNHRLYHNTTIPITRLTGKLGNFMQLATQTYNRRPYGVGMLIAGYDDQGPHIYQICPSANFFECRAMAIGGRSESARTYFQKNMEVFPCCSLEELIKHGLCALKSTLPSDVEVNSKTISIGVAGADQDFEMYNEERINLCLRYAGDLSGADEDDDGDDEPTEVIECARKASGDTEGGETENE